jgi:hypothetical protein
MDDDAASFRITSVNDDFNQSLNTWQYGFADFPVSTEDSAYYELQYAYTSIPGLGKRAIMLSGNNHGDDLFMYVKRKVANLDPNTQYTLTFDVEFASDAKAGAEGGPGENVFLKVGASNVEPKTIIEGDEHVLNIDKGPQGVNGGNMVVIGNIAVPSNSNGYVLQTRTNSPYNNDTYNFPVVATTNIDGELWFIVGTDSGYEGVTSLYYSKISVVLSQVK